MTLHCIALFLAHGNVYTGLHRLGAVHLGWFAHQERHCFVSSESRLQWQNCCRSLQLIKALLCSLQGFIRFKRGLGGFGQCSIAHEPAYAIKTHPNPSPRDIPAVLALAAGDTSSRARASDA